MSKRKKKYLKYMKSEAWREKREESLRLHDFTCGDCGKRLFGALDVHHLTYRRLGNERMSDLLPLCHGCHNLRHKRKIRVRRKRERPTLRELGLNPRAIGTNPRVSKSAKFFE
jgi:5-methylcytosine-specific restriction endonuclease McrA